MDSIEEANQAPLKESRNESELLLSQVADENEKKSVIELLNISTISLNETDYYADWGFELDDDDLFLFGVGGPA